MGDIEGAIGASVTGDALGGLMGEAVVGVWVGELVGLRVKHLTPS